MSYIVGWGLKDRILTILCGDTHYTIPHMVTREKNSPTADHAGHKGDQNVYLVHRGIVGSPCPRGWWQADNLSLKKS